MDGTRVIVKLNFLGFMVERERGEVGLREKGAFEFQIFSQEDRICVMSVKCGFLTFLLVQRLTGP